MNQFILALFITCLFCPGVALAAEKYCFSDDPPETCKKGDLVWANTPIEVMRVCDLNKPVVQQGAITVCYFIGERRTPRNPNSRWQKAPAKKNEGFWLNNLNEEGQEMLGGPPKEP